MQRDACDIIKTSPTHPVKQHGMCLIMSLQIILKIEESKRIMVRLPIVQLMIIFIIN